MGGEADMKVMTVVTFARAASRLVVVPMELFDAMGATAQRIVGTRVTASYWM
jgi:hypothetical protein